LAFPLASWLRGRWEVGTALFNVALGATSALSAFLIIFLKGNLIDVGAFFTIYSAVSVPALFFWGKLSDIFADRGDIVALSYALSGLSLFGMAFSSSVDVLFAFGGLLSFFSSAMASITSMMAVEEVPEALWNKRVGVANAYINYGYGLGLLMDIAFAGYAAAREAFIISAGLSLLSALLVHESMKDVSVRKIQREAFHKLRVARSRHTGEARPSQHSGFSSPKPKIDPKASQGATRWACGFTGLLPALKGEVCRSFYQRKS